jgi:hypothetical protein
VDDASVGRQARMINAQDWSRAEINEWLANLPIKPDYSA